MRKGYLIGAHTLWSRRHLELLTHTPAEIEEADFRQVANPTNTILLPTEAVKSKSRGQIIKHLSNVIPRNDYGLPMFYVRSDLLDWTRIESYGYVTQDDLQVASEVLTYEEGYPCQKSGSPFWVQMRHEPHQAYILFQNYLALSDTDGVRLLDTLASNEVVPLENIREMAYEYYWSARAKSYDLFVVAAEAKKRESRTRKAEDSHFTIAGGLIDSIVARLNAEPELVKNMDAKDLFDLFEQMVKIQRLSLGLTGQNASTNQGLPMSPGGSVEVILRQLTQKVGLSGDAQEGMHNRLKLLMGDPNTAMVAQELVIRATTDNMVHTTVGPDSGAIDVGGQPPC